MIPKLIHLCWLSGDPYPDKIEYCISSWRKIIPEYKVILWDWEKCKEENILNDWVEEAYSARKFAFAADYIRLYAVYKYGGIYLDSDVEVIKPFDKLLRLPYFVGREAVGNRIEVAAFGAEKGCKWVKQCLEYYNKRHFLVDGVMDMKVIPDIVYEVLRDDYIFKDISDISAFNYSSNIINIFPRDRFCANIYLEDDNFPTLSISKSTFCVHHFVNSWVKRNYKAKLFDFVKTYFGRDAAKSLFKLLVKIKRCIKSIFPS